MSLQNLYQLVSVQFQKHPIMQLVRKCPKRNPAVDKIDDETAAVTFLNT